MTGYVRQHAANIVTNAVIYAAHLNGEFNAIAAAFDATSGHTHDGSIGGGAPIVVIGPGQEVEVTSSAVMPDTNNAIDLGSDSVRFKDAYLEGNLTVGGAANVGGGIGVTGASTITASTGAALTVTNTGTGNSFVVNDEAGDTTPFVIDANGITVVGHTSSVPMANSVTPGLQVHGGTVQGSLSMVNWGETAASHRLILAHSRSNTVGTHVALEDADHMGNIRFEGSDGTVFQTGAAIVGAVEGSVASGIVPGRLIFQTADINGTLRNRMVITSDGVVGVGTVTPNAAALLDLTSTSKVFVPPRMTTTQRNNISSVPAGGIIFNTTTNKHQGFDGTNWNDLY